MKNLGRTVGEYFKDTILRDVGFRDWYQFFAYLQEKVVRRLILVIDEFPYLIHSNQAISSIFQKGIDEHLAKTDMVLIFNPD